jgi:hypothetical protein
MTARFTPPPPPVRSENTPPAEPDRRAVGTTSIGDKVRHIAALFCMLSVFGVGIWVVLVGVTSRSIGWLEGSLIALFGLPAFVVGSVWVLFPIIADFHVTRVVIWSLYQHVTVVGDYWSTLFRGFDRYADRNYAKSDQGFAVIHDWQLNGVDPRQVDDLRHTVGDYGSQIDQLASLVADLHRQGVTVERGRVVDAEPVDGDRSPIGPMIPFDQSTRRFTPVPYTDHMRRLVDLALANETPSIRNATEKRKLMSRPDYDVALRSLLVGGVFVKVKNSVGLRPGIRRPGDRPADVQERIATRLSMGGYNE